MNKRYVAVVSFFTFVLPLAGAFGAHAFSHAIFSFGLFGKWFIFSAVGCRLFVAGIHQTIKPGFTSKTIFGIHDPQSLPIVRELGFANLCFGLVALVSFCIREWRIVSAFASGLYYGLAAGQHLIKRSAGANETFALWTDAIIFGVLATYCLVMW